MAPLANIYRAIAGDDVVLKGKKQLDRTPTINDAEVVTFLGAIAPVNIVRLSRLLLFVRLVCKAPVFVLNTLGAVSSSKSAWLNIVRDDLTWITSFEKAKECVGWSFAEWRKAIVSNPGPFKMLFVCLCKCPDAIASQQRSSPTNMTLQMQFWLCPDWTSCFSTKQAMVMVMVEYTPKLGAGSCGHSDMRS